MRSPRPNRSGRVIGRARGEAFRRFMLGDLGPDRDDTPVYVIVGIMALCALGLAARAGWPAWMALLSGAPWTSEVSWIGRSGRPVVARVSLLASWSAVVAVAALVVVAVCIYYHLSGDQDHGGQ